MLDSAEEGGDGAPAPIAPPGAVPGAARARPGRRIGWHLAVLCLAIVIPVLALAGALAALYVAAERDRLGQSALRAAASASLALDRDLAGLIAATDILALSTTIQAGDLDAFDSQARRVRDRLGVNVVMRDRTGLQVVNTRVPRGAPLPRNIDFASDRRVLETGRADISDLVEGAVARIPLFVVNVPVFRDGDVEYLLNLSLPPERVHVAVQAGAAASGWTVTVVDRSGTVIADTARHADTLGQRLAGEAWWRDGPAEGLRELSLPWEDRPPHLAAHMRSALSGWTLIVSVPPSQAAAPLRLSLASLGMLAVALLGMSAGLALVFARRIARAVATLAQGTRLLGQGEDVARPRTGLREIDEAGHALALAAADRRGREAEIGEGAARLRLALEAAEFGRWEVDLRTGLASRSGKVVPPRPGLDIAGYRLEDFLQRVVHPEDVARVRASFEALSAGRADRHRVEYRVRTPDDDGWLWMESYGGVVERDPVTGAAWRVSGVSRDVSDRKAAEAQRRILLREVDHRAKNALAVAQSVVALTKADDPAQYAKVVNGRISALARAHTRLAAGGWTGVDLRTLLSDGLQPFGAASVDDPVEDPARDSAGEEALGPRLELRGDAVELPGDIATPVAMVMHELATNASKHGALSVRGGSVRVTWAVDSAGMLRLTWAESGGPRVEAPSASRGFGSRMIDATIRQQLGGSLHLDWAAGGLRCEMAFQIKGGSARRGEAPDGGTLA